MKKPLCFAAYLFTLTSLSAQPVLTAANTAPQPGDSSTYYSVDPIPPSIPGASGAGVIWDFSTIPGSFPNTTHYVEPSTTGSGSNFPMASVAAYIFHSRDEYYQTTVDSCVLWGKVIFPSITLIYDNPELIMPYPLHYLDTAQDTFHYYYFEGSDTSEYTGYKTMVADGYGQLLLPGVTINNVLRLKHSYYTLPGSPDSVAFTLYYWYSPGIHDYLFSCLENPSGYHAQYRLATEAVGVHELTALPINLGLYPNPVQDLLSVSCDLDISRIEVFDLTGKIVDDRCIPPATGYVQVNTKTFERGLYYIAVYSGETKVSKTFIKW